MGRRICGDGVVREEVKPTDFETRLELVVDLNLEFPSKVVRGALHLGELVLRTRS